MNMDGKTVLVTGSTDGVGRYVAARLAAAGAKVLIHGRDGGAGQGPCRRDRAGRARRSRVLSGRSVVAGRRRGSSPTRCWPITSGSTSSSAMPASDRRTTGPQRQISADGHELRFAVNYLAGFLLAYRAAAAAQGERAVAHRQCRLARPASDRFRRCHDHEGLQRQPRLRAEQAVADHVHHRSRRGTEGDRRHRQFASSRRPT